MSTSTVGEAQSMPAAKTPWHLWVIGVIAVLWNSIGALDFTMTQLDNDAYLKAFTPQQREYFRNFPLWSEIGWCLGTYGGFIGSFLLLFRHRLAVPVYAASIVGIIITCIWSYGVSDWQQVMGGGTGAMIFSAIILTIGVALWAYARAMRRRGVLR